MWMLVWRDYLQWWIWFMMYVMCMYCMIVSFSLFRMFRILLWRALRILLPVARFSAQFHFTCVQCAWWWNCVLSQRLQSTINLQYNMLASLTSIVYRFMICRHFALFCHTIFLVGPRQHIAFLLVGLVHSECAVSLCSGMPSHFGLLLNTQYRKKPIFPEDG